MKRPYGTFAVSALLALALALVFLVYAHPTHAAGSGTITQLDQWTSTTSPSSAITQQTYGKAIKVTGLATGQCLTLDANMFLTTTTCGSAGSSYPFALSGNATSTLTQFNGGITAFASSTIGNGTQTGGLTVNGGATTTGSSYISGKLGVGNSAPTSKLFVQDVIADAGSAPLVEFNNSRSGSTDQVRFSLTRGADAGTGITKGTVIFGSSGAAGWADYEARRLSFWTGTSAGSATEKVSILGNGSVGINNNSPSYKLDVSGNSRFISSGGAQTRLAYDSSNYVDLTSDSTGQLFIDPVGNRVIVRAASGGVISTFVNENSTGGNGTGSGFLFATGGATAFVGGMAAQRTDTLTNGRVAIRVLSNGTLSGTDSSSLFYIQGAASPYSVFNTSLGINDTSPTYDLDITGNAHVSSFLDASYLVATSSTRSLFVGGFQANASSTLQDFTGVNATTTNATTTTLFASTASTTNFYGAGLSSCNGASNALTWAAGVFGCNSITGGGAYPFALTGNATSTLTQFNGGLTAFASSTIGNGTATGGLTISGNATTTNLTIIGFSGALSASSGVVSSGTLSIANGGTNQTSFGTSNGLVAYDGTRLTNYSAYTLTSSLLTATNASTTALTAGSYFYSGGLAGFGSTTPTYPLSVNTSGSQFAVNSSGGILSAASQPATSTAMTLDWNATPPQVEYRVGTAAFSITLINATTSGNYGTRKLIELWNPGSTAGAVTFNGIEFASAYTQTTAANKGDLISCHVTHATSSTAYKVICTAGAGSQ